MELSSAGFPRKKWQQSLPLIAYALCDIKLRHSSVLRVHCAEGSMRNITKLHNLVALRKLHNMATQSTTTITDS